MVHDTVRGGGLLEGRSLVARLAATRSARPGPLAFGALALLLPATVACGGLAAVAAVERRAPFELGDARAQPGILFQGRVQLPAERPGQLQHALAPLADGLADHGREGSGAHKVGQTPEGFLADAELLLPERCRHQPRSTSVAMMAASTARRSPGGMA